MDDLEFRDYVLFFKKFIWLIFVFGLLGAAIGFVFSSKPKVFESSTLLYVSFEREKEEGQFSFEGFYQQERARNFTDSALSLISSEEFQKEIFGSTKVSVKKLAPQILKATFRSQNRDEVLPTIEGFVEKSNEKISSLPPAESALNISLITKVEEPKETIPKTPLNILVGLLVGILLGAVFASLYSYFQKSPKKSSK